MLTKRDKYDTGQLTARPGTPTKRDMILIGEQPLGLDTAKDGLIYVPQGYNESRPAALAVLLHGAGAPAEQGLSLLRRYADEKNMILLAPTARKYTWDIIANDILGPDVQYIDEALALVFENYAIDAARVAIGGFSDGASYALSLGLTNGDLFTHIMAFSPGFAYTLKIEGNPAIFISHGVNDEVLPIGPCARQIVPQLQQQGLEVNYEEFDGGHEVPATISERAVAWFTGEGQ